MSLVPGDGDVEKGRGTDTDNTDTPLPLASEGGTGIILAGIMLDENKWNPLTFNWTPKQPLNQLFFSLVKINLCIL